MRWQRGSALRHATRVTSHLQPFSLVHALRSTCDSLHNAARSITLGHLNAIATSLFPVSIAHWNHSHYYSTDWQSIHHTVLCHHSHETCFLLSSRVMVVCHVQSGIEMCSESAAYRLEWQCHCMPHPLCFISSSVSE